MRIDRYTRNPDSDQDLKKHNQLINQTMDNSQNPVEAPKQLNNFSAVNDRKPAKKKKKRRKNAKPVVWGKRSLAAKYGTDSRLLFAFAFCMTFVKDAGRARPSDRAYLE